MSEKTCMTCNAGEVDSYDYPCIACDKTYSKWEPKPDAIAAKSRGVTPEQIVVEE